MASLGSLEHRAPEWWDPEIHLRAYAWPRVETKLTASMIALLAVTVFSLSFAAGVLFALLNLPR